MNTNTTVEPILTEDHIVEVEIPRIREVEITQGFLKFMKLQPILTEDHIPEVLEDPMVEPVLTEDHVLEVEIPEVLEALPAVEPTLTEEHIIEVEIPEAILEVPVVPLKRIRKKRSAKKVKMEKYSPMPGIRIKRIANILRLVYSKDLTVD
jgi:hypothetical protein